MKNPKQLRWITLLMVLSALTWGCNDSKKEVYNQIKEGFVTPAAENTLWCYWYWINDDISKEGITKDLEAMKEAGIGATFIGNINPDGVDGKVPLFSEAWWDAMVHAVNEGKRLGIDIGSFNCPGWSQSGGPWVSHDKAMRYHAWSETVVNGPGKIEVTLPQPKEEFQDTYVLAIPRSPSEDKILARKNPAIKVQPLISDVSKWFDGDTTSYAYFKRDIGEFKIEVSLEKEMEANSLIVSSGWLPFKCDMALYARINRKDSLITRFTYDRSNLWASVGPIIHGPLALAIPTVTARDFTIVCNNIQTGHAQVGFSEIGLSKQVVLDRFIEKQMGKMDPTPFPTWYSYLWEPQAPVTDPESLIPAGQVLNISEHMTADGKLTWEAPEGEWTILRFGMTPTGTKNSPSAPQGRGYEIDKMSSTLARFHFENYIGEYLSRIPEENRSAFKYVIADSYEQGSQNWTDGYADKFMQKYGYDPVPFLPVLSGRIVEDVETTERFLWDLRRAVADDIAYEYVGGLRQVSNEHNLQLWLENYGHWGFPSEFLMYGGQSNLVGGEFWNEGSLGDIECKAASSAAHIYGKPITSAEAFTAAMDSYKRHPALLKKRGDWSYTEGINHFVLHLYIHQPDSDRIPGVNAWFSTEFNRHNTWFSSVDSYFDYLRRCQHMLQQGKYVADVCYFIGENTPLMTGVRHPELPKGYSYDYINAEVILDRLTVENGRFVLPDGMSYRLMVLPPLKTMRPEVLAKIESLVKAGGVVLGPKPERSPSLENYPACDTDVKTIADRLWSGEAQTKGVNKVGNGMIVNDLSLEEVFATLNIIPDVEMEADVPVLWTHRNLSGMDIYFLTNQSQQQINPLMKFRVKGKVPMIWNAVDGDIRMARSFELDGEQTGLQIPMEPLQSWFVVFVDEQLAVDNYALMPDFTLAREIARINDDWSVDFKNKEIGPAEKVFMPELTDWTDSEDPRVRFYSGEAVYSRTLNFDTLPEGELYLNLGEVNVMATVRINGQEVGTSWIAPHRLNLTGYLNQGENQLEIEVVNLWRNQLIRDLNVKPEERTTWVSVSDARADEQPAPSGLKGPVTIELLAR